MKCPLGRQVPSDVPGCWLLQQMWKTVKRGRGRCESRFSAKIVTFSKNIRKSVGRRNPLMGLHFIGKGLYVAGT